MFAYSITVVSTVYNVLRRLSLYDSCLPDDVWILHCVCKLIAADVMVVVKMAKDSKRCQQRHVDGWKAKKGLKQRHPKLQKMQFCYPMRHKLSATGDRGFHWCL